MRVSSRSVAAILAALLAVSSPVVHGVANCNDCPGGKTCILEDKSFTLGAGQSSFPIKFCNFDVAKKADYALSFRLKKPLECDPNNTLMPAVASLSPQDGCSQSNCVVTAALKQSIDWAVLLKNGGDVSVLQAKLDGGNDEVVQVAQGTSDSGASAITGGDNAPKATVCSTAFGVKAARLSKLGACNKVSLCRGKPADTACTTPVPTVSSVHVDDVSCSAENCAATLTLEGGLPCDAASGDGNAVLVSITVGNGDTSAYASIASLSSAPAATISSALGASVGSSQVTIKSDATCPQKSLNVTVDGLAINGIAPANGTILISLATALTTKQAGSNLDIVVSQCGVVSKELTVMVGETSGEALPPSPKVELGGPSKLGGNTTSGGDVVGSVGPRGTQRTQEENASTGLPYGVYIGIGVGSLALVGFCFECWYHRRRHRKEHGPGTSGVNAA